jgi:hypothetical protein
MKQMTELLHGFSKIDGAELNYFITHRHNLANVIGVGAKSTMAVRNFMKLSN